jgi:hypothetical protein
MEKKSFIILLFFVVAFIAIVLISHRTYKGEIQTGINYTDEEKIFLNHQCEDLKCIASNFSSCTIAEYAKNGKRIAIYGFASDKCHIRTVSSDCYLNESQLTIPILNQLLGNDEGLEIMLSQYCQ